MGRWLQANREKRTDLGLRCRIQWHLDIKALPVPEQKKKKKLQHISGIFQLMMCGCGSAGEKESDCAFFVRSERAPYSIPVSSAYFGNSCGVFFLYCIQFMNAAYLSLHISFSNLQTWQYCCHFKWIFRGKPSGFTITVFTAHLTVRERMARPETKHGWR